MWCPECRLLLSQAYPSPMAPVPGAPPPALAPSTPNTGLASARAPSRPSPSSHDAHTSVTRLSSDLWPGGTARSATPASQSLGPVGIAWLPQVVASRHDSTPPRFDPLWSHSRTCEVFLLTPQPLLTGPLLGPRLWAHGLSPAVPGLILNMVPIYAWSPTQPVRCLPCSWPPSVLQSPVATPPCTSPLEPSPVRASHTKALPWSKPPSHLHPCSPVPHHVCPIGGLLMCPLSQTFGAVPGLSQASWPFYVFPPDDLSSSPG